MLQHHDECAIGHVRNQMLWKGLECEARLMGSDREINWGTISRLDRLALNSGVRDRFGLLTFGDRRPGATAGVLLGESITDLTRFLQYIGHDMRKINES